MKPTIQAWIDVTAKLPMDEKIKQRAERAYREILTGYGYSVKEHSKEGYTIEKLSTSLLEDNSVVYHVTKDHCSCPDFPTARAGLCKHRIAVLVIENQKKG